MSLGAAIGFGLQLATSFEPIIRRAAGNPFTGSMLCDEVGPNANVVVGEWFTRGSFSWASFTSRNLLVAGSLRRFV